MRQLQRPLGLARRAERRSPIYVTGNFVVVDYGGQPSRGEESLQLARDTFGCPYCGITWTPAEPLKSTRAFPKRRDEAPTEPWVERRKS